MYYGKHVRIGNQNLQIRQVIPMERGLQTRNVLMGERSPDGASLKFEDENLNTNYLISSINKALPGSTELDSKSYLKSL